MSHFRFRLDALLRLQRTVVRQEEMRLGRLLAHRAQIASHLAEIESAEDQYREELQRRALTGTNGAELAFGKAAICSLHHHATRLQADLKRLVPSIENQRALYLAAQVEQAKVEKLREQAHNAWRQESNRREQRAADEIFLLRRHRDSPTP
jgi:flagellar export protein FliJ